ncbi:MAG: hypothetical protein ABIH52_03130 [Candidatus Aenigmatarchaeota archaeon]
MSGYYRSEESIDVIDVADAIKKVAKRDVYGWRIHHNHLPHEIAGYSTIGDHADYGLAVAMGDTLTIDGFESNHSIILTTDGVYIRSKNQKNRVKIVDFADASPQS